MTFEINFIPNTETEALEMEEKINYILERVTKKKILVLENGLTSQEEFSLIKNTMQRINYKDFVGIKLETFSGGETVKKSLFSSTAKKSIFTIIAPEQAVNVLKDDKGILSLKIGR